MEISELYKIYKSKSSICTDTRKIEKGGLFFALKGESFNGNLFAAKAISDGCSFAIIDEKKIATNNKFILVKNVLETLQNLAKHHRKQLSIPIIGITGTNGKTTSKELIHAVLKSELNSYATKGNLNNHIGVPLSILEITKEHEIAIIEMGANHEKEIEFLCEIAKPTHGVITNIGSAHLEGFKNHQGVINAKNELFNFIKKNNGLLFVNDNDNLLLNLSQKIERITYGNNGFCKGFITKNTPYLSIKFSHTEINSQLIGEYQFSNIMHNVAKLIFSN
jgi:UDP-N-acetylmuramoyl-tripeptide--D-alanyl-D-alanine ligase